jgi:hypothetical protein
MGDYGLKISKPNVNVGTAGFDNLILQSNNPILKIQSSGTGSIQVVNDGADYDVLVSTHNLGYKPLFDFQTQWYSLDGAAPQTTYISAPYYNSTYADLAIWALYKPYNSGTTALRYTVSLLDGWGGTFTLNYKYTIYYDQDI